MKFENTAFEGFTVEYRALEEIMDEAGFYPVYDYERVTFDYKMVDHVHDDVYYFRVQGYAVEGEIPSPRAVVKLMTPILGKHYYPHGVEYDEEFPQNIIDKCYKKIETINKGIQEESTPL